MYKKQMKFQKLLCTSFLAASALVFIYSLGLLTDLYNLLYYTMTDQNNPHATLVEGSWIFYDMQPFNSMLTTASIILICCSVLMYLTCTHSRRKYYVGNYVAIAISSFASIAVSVWGIVNISAFRTQFLTTLDFEALEAFCKIMKIKYHESTFWFDAGYFVFSILIIVAALLVYNLIWKRALMKEEAKILSEGLEA